MLDHRYKLLLTIVCAQVVVLGLELPWPFTDLFTLFAVAVAAILLRVIRGRRGEIIAFVVLGCSAPLLNLVIPWQTWAPLDVFKVAVWFAAPAYLAGLIFVSIYDADQIRHEEILGAIALYVLIGLVFANVYETVMLVLPDSLHTGDAFGARDLGFADLLYFSFVTLATLGFGDIAPAHPVTRLVAVAESIVGLMYMAILVARFVSLHVRDRPGREPAG